MATASVPAAPTRSLASTLISDRPRRWAREIIAVTAGITLIALLAKVSVPMVPVPITGQTLGVLLVGAAFGARRGAATLTAYGLVGLLGIPVFAGPTAGPLSVLSPSFGYVIGFIPAAWLAGLLADRGWDRSVPKAAAAATAATVVPFVIGVPYLGVILAASGNPPTLAEALAWGVWPFLLGGAIKAALAALALPAAWRLHRRLRANGRGL
ncbi:MAG: biotin transporter BioY [Microbacterium sp.]|uniref:biotin transporter BioY n=1 Tax=Microbacterium sp. TaxID=51671 RepID=UPI001ACFA00E|nr:biotin transporter BioY [Microbacterium sp.]MBN9176548.1 biotin transporter BioY [Microbacterium sp.]